MPLFGDRRFEMDENGRTCFHYAVWGGSLKVMRYLVDWCNFDPGLRTAVSCNCAYLAYYTCMHTQCMRHHYVPCMCVCSK